MKVTKEDGGLVYTLDDIEFEYDLESFFSFLL